MRKPSLYTAAGIRVILEHVHKLQKYFEAGNDAGVTTEICAWKQELEKQLHNKEQWAKFYQSLRGQNDTV